MKVIGIIAEYNPFHLGHLYQINKVKEMYPNSLVITIISPNYTERGEISIINKWDKARILLDNMVDLVVELPTLFATQSADIFASSALKILNQFNIDILVFGSEGNDVNLLTNLANIQLNDTNYNLLVKKYLDDGINYPTAMSKALYDISNITIDKPNDLLALSYIKEIIKNNYSIEAVSIKRTNDYHGKNIDGDIINASLIRELLNDNKNIDRFLPDGVSNYINNISYEKAYDLLRYQIINNINNLDDFLDVDEGIESRIIKYINDSSSWNTLVNYIKTKRYTYNKVNRMLIHILLGIKKNMKDNDVYFRILGFNNNGKSYLNKIKKDIQISIINDTKMGINDTLDIELRACFIYSLITNNDDCYSYEYKNKPIII